MNFSEILRASFALTWRYRWMWLVGFLLSPQLLGESFYQVNYTPGQEFPWDEVLALVLVGGLMALIMFVASILINPALILAATTGHRGGAVLAGESFRQGSDFFLRYLLLTLVWFAITLAVVIMLLLPLIIAAVVHPLLALVVGLFFVPVLIAAVLAIYAISCYAYRNLVLDNLQVLDAVQRGYALFKTRLWPSIGLAVVAVLITIAIILPLTFMVLIPQSILTALAGDNVFSQLIKYGFSLLISVPVYGYLGAWNSNLWTIAFLEWFKTPQAANKEAVPQEP